VSIQNGQPTSWATRRLQGAQLGGKAAAPGRGGAQDGTGLEDGGRVRLHTVGEQDLPKGSFARLHDRANLGRDLVFGQRTDAWHDPTMGQSPGSRPAMAAVGGGTGPAAHAGGGLRAAGRVLPSRTGRR